MMTKILHLGLLLAAALAAALLCGDPLPDTLARQAIDPTALAPQRLR
jgi:hypothetical protein